VLAICGYLTAAAWGYAALPPELVHAESKAKDVGLNFSGRFLAPVILTWFAGTGDSSAISVGASRGFDVDAGGFVLRVTHAAR